MSEEQEDAGARRRGPDERWGSDREGGHVRPARNGWIDTTNERRSRLWDATGARATRDRPRHRLHRKSRAEAEVA